MNYRSANYEQHLETHTRGGISRRAKCNARVQGAKLASPLSIYVKRIAPRRYDYPTVV